MRRGARVVGDAADVKVELLASLDGAL